MEVLKCKLRYFQPTYLDFCCTDIAFLHHPNWVIRKRSEFVFSYITLHVKCALRTASTLNFVSIYDNLGVKLFHYCHNSTNAKGHFWDTSGFDTLGMSSSYKSQLPTCTSVVQSKISSFQIKFMPAKTAHLPNVNKKAGPHWEKDVTDIWCLNDRSRIKLHQLCKDWMSVMRIWAN